MSRTYTTVQGDLWDTIAFRELGDTAYMDRLMRANTAYLDYYVFPAGITLVLPDVHERASGASLPPWKQVAG